MIKITSNFDNVNEFIAQILNKLNAQNWGLIFTGTSNRAKVHRPY
jgi:hypothetical protein